MPSEPPSPPPAERRASIRLWPYPTRAAVLAVPLIAVVLLAAILTARAVAEWPGPESDNLLLVGVLLFSLLPVLLVLVDLVAGRGGSIAFRDVRIDFGGAVEPASAITIPQNIGFPGQPVTDSDTTEIIDTLRRHTGNEIVVVDLEDGDAWWETRLLILCAGAARVGRPRAVVFVATQRTPRRYQGWAPPADLVRALLRADPGYRAAYATAQAAAEQWKLVPPPPPVPGQAQPPALPWFSPLAVNHGWMAWRLRANRWERNEFAQEQYLANELGALEPPESGITVVRLQELAGSVLRTAVIDQSWSDEARLEALLASDEEYVAVTSRGQYVGLLSHAAGLSVVLQALARQARGRGAGS